MSNSDSTQSLRRRAPVPKEVCALAKAAEEIGDRWSLLILREAFYGVMRYDDMRVDLGIPRSVLSDRLAKLVASGCLEKRRYQEAGDRPRSAYVLAEKGKDLATALIALTRWSEAHILGKPGPVEIVDQTTGKALTAALVDQDGAVVPAERAGARVRVAKGKRRQRSDE